MKRMHSKQEITSIVNQGIQSGEVKVYQYQNPFNFDGQLDEDNSIEIPNAIRAQLNKTLYYINIYDSATSYQFMGYILFEDDVGIYPLETFDDTGIASGSITCGTDGSKTLLTLGGRDFQEDSLSITLIPIL